MSTTRYAERKALQRAVPLKGKKCERCGTKRGLQRHHVSYKGVKKFMILCQACHAELHSKRGDWGAQPGADDGE